MHRPAPSALPVRLFAGLLASALAFPSVAETPMSASEFETYTTGKTLTFSANGTAYGIEEYLDERRVRWAFLDGECQDGTWFPAGDMICFVYETMPTPQCWHFFRESRGLRARFLNDPAEDDLFETRQSREPLFCPGPTPGV